MFVSARSTARVYDPHHLTEILGLMLQLVRSYDLKKSWTIQQQLSLRLENLKDDVTVSVTVTRNADLPQIFIECTAMQ